LLPLVCLHAGALKVVANPLKTYLLYNDAIG
jgi:hypothetical protein